MGRRNKNFIFLKILLIALTIGILLIYAGCTKLRDLKMASYTTLKKDIVGDICAELQGTGMPVKILLVVDISASNGGAYGTGTDTDPVVTTPGPDYGTTKRLRAFRELLDHFVPTYPDYDPNFPSNYHFGVITFNGSPNVLTQDSDGKGLFYNPHYRNDAAWQALKAVEFHADGLTSGTGTTNYVQTFEAIVDFVRADMHRTPGNEVSRTSYKIIFVTDGIPDDGKIGEGNLPDPNFFNPDISYFTGNPADDGCMANPYSDPGSSYCARGFTNSGSHPPTSWLYQFFRPGLLSVGQYGDYIDNVVYDLSDSSTSVLKTIERTKSTERGFRFNKEEDGVVYTPVEVSWNAIYYNVVAAPTNYKLLAQQYVAERILQDIADDGNGTFVSLIGTSEISFIDNVPLNPGMRKYQLNGFFIRNKNAVILTDGEVAPDSDMDGLHDDRELELGTNPLLGDTDGDGLWDGIEYEKTSFDPTVYDVNCAGIISDVDNDNLNKCEEMQLLTNESSFDTDRDGIPDGLEIIYGLNPNKNDRNDDNDFDGINNFNEVVMHRNPNIPNKIDFDADDHSFSFKLNAYTNSQNQNCYHIEIRNLEVVKTGDGINNIEISSVLIPEDNPTEKGLFAVVPITINFDETKDGKDENTIYLENLIFTYN